MKKVKNITLLLSILSSLTICGFSGYLFSLSYRWFIAFAIYFALDSLVLLININKSDSYKGMKSLGNFELLGSISMIVVLLAMIFYGSGVDESIFIMTSSILGGVVFIKFIISIINWIYIHKQYAPELHALRNSSLLSIALLVLMLELIIFYRFFPENRPLWVFFIEVGSNALSLVFSAFIALSTIIRGKTKEELTTFKKIEHVKDWFVENEITMIFGFIYTLYISALAIMSASKSAFYIFLAVYYLGMGFIRFINYIWHKGISATSSNKIRDNRWSSWILLFNAVSFTLFSDVICVGALILMLEKFGSDTNMYYFIFLIVPFAVVRFIFAIRGLKKHTKDNNTYRLGLAYISLLTALMSVMNVVAISCHQVESSIKLGIIIAIVIVLKVFVIILSIAFVVMWFKSLVINRRSKEKKYLKQNK